jgi:GNAT superfamily N-acetyltransferase
MGKSSAETVREIEDTRDRLESEIRELEDRLPQPAVWTKRLVGVAVGGGLGGTLFWFGVKRIRGRKEAKKRRKQSAPVNAVIQVLPEEWSKRVGKALENGQAKNLAIGVGGVWLVLRLAELRQLRRMNRALLAGAR